MLGSELNNLDFVLFTWCGHTLKQIMLLFLTMLIDICRYFEGQISPILEADNEADVEHSPIRVTEAAEKVSSFSIYLCGPWIV